MNAEKYTNDIKNAVLNSGYDGYAKYMTDQIEVMNQHSDDERAKNYRMFTDGLIEWVEQDGIRAYILKHLPDENIEDSVQGVVNFLMKNVSVENGEVRFSEKLNVLLHQAIADAQSQNAPNN